LPELDEYRFSSVVAFRGTNSGRLWRTRSGAGFEPSRLLRGWLADYNATYLHSALGYRAPRLSKPNIAATQRHCGSLLKGEQCFSSEFHY
jgi:hypothetical protein